MQYLDVSIAKRLHRAAHTEVALQNVANLGPQMMLGENATKSIASPPEGEQYEFPTPQIQAHTKAFEDQYFNMLYGPWEGDNGVADLGLVLQAEDPMQMESLNFLSDGEPNR